MERRKEGEGRKQRGKVGLIREIETVRQLENVWRCVTMTGSVCVCGCICLYVVCDMK